MRTAGLMGQWPANALADHLSGLVIGAELKAGLDRFASQGPMPPVSVVGGASLTQRYAMAMKLFGRDVRELAGDAAFAGLLLVARQAGLVVAPAL